MKEEKEGRKNGCKKRREKRDRNNVENEGKYKKRRKGRNKQCRKRAKIQINTNEGKKEEKK